MINAFILLFAFLVACGDKDADTAVEDTAEQTEDTQEVEEVEEGSEEETEE